GEHVIDAAVAAVAGARQLGRVRAEPEGDLNERAAVRVVAADRVGAAVASGVRAALHLRHAMAGGHWRSLGRSSGSVPCPESLLRPGTMGDERLSGAFVAPPRGTGRRLQSNG